VNIADHLRRQFAYDEWANREVLTAIRSGGAAKERSLHLMAHIIAAERLWLERLKQQPQSTSVWPQAGVEDCEKQAAEIAAVWREYLDLITAGDVAQSVSYKNSKGEAWTSTILDVLTHVLLHSAYHRGQIASHMRAHGQTPAYTDFIHCVRQGLIK
jgi:uncharacterized damage-inducible protein DinB